VTWRRTSRRRSSNLVAAVLSVGAAIWSMSEGLMSVWFTLESQRRPRRRRSHRPSRPGPRRSLRPLHWRRPRSRRAHRRLLHRSPRDRRRPLRRCLPYHRRHLPQRPRRRRQSLRGPLLRPLRRYRRPPRSLRGPPLRPLRRYRRPPRPWNLLDPRRRSPQSRHDPRFRWSHQCHRGLRHPWYPPSHRGHRRGCPCCCCCNRPSRGRTRAPTPPESVSSSCSSSCAPIPADGFASSRTTRAAR
jgi:hypothetical protein